MGYPSEFAHKLAHCPLVVNAEVLRTVGACATVPTAASATALANLHLVTPSKDLSEQLQIQAMDGSRWELSLERQKHRLGYVQAGLIQFSLVQYATLDQSPRTNPFAISQLLRQRQLWGLCLPSTGVWWQNCTSVRAGFRVLSERFLAQTRLSPQGRSLRDILFTLAAERPGPLATGDDRFLRVHRCPDCGRGPAVVCRSVEESPCGHCGAPIYASDCLRVHEEVREDQSNRNALTRLMLVLEQLLMMLHVETMARDSAARVWFADGPLALFGPASWLHAPIQASLHELTVRAGKVPFTLVGVQKTGQLVKHARRLRASMPRQSIFVVTDDYRYRHIILSRDPNSAGFGRQTHYGQDFVYHTARGQLFVFSLPYPAARKASPAFDTEKTELDRYPQLSLVLALLERLSSGRFPGTLVPTLLAHQVTAISRRPGAEVLKLFSQAKLGKRA